MNTCTRCGEPWLPKLQDIVIKVSDPSSITIHAKGKLKPVKVRVPACEHCFQLDYDSDEVKAVVKEHRRIYGSG